jgi:succinate dehydrogenase / fumarate reductase, membrane anchor subunit
MLFELLTAKYPGMRQWLTQRLSAASMAIFVLVLVIRLSWLNPSSFDTWHAFFSPIWWRIFTLWFFLCMLIHAWLGVRDVLRDYVFNMRLRAVMQIAVDMILVVNLIGVTWILFGLRY